MMKDKILEILKKYEGYVDRSRTDCCIWSDDYNDIANEIITLHNDLVQEAVEDLQGVKNEDK